MQRVHPKDNPDKVSKQHQEIVIHHCKICSKKFIDEQDLLSHVAAKHKTRPCPTCGSKFWSKIELKRHINKRHTKTATINDLPPEENAAPIKDPQPEGNDAAIKSLDLERTTKQQKRPLSVEKSNSKDTSKKMKRSSSGTGGSKLVNQEDDNDKSDGSAKPSTSKIDTGGASSSGDGGSKLVNQEDDNDKSDGSAKPSTSKIDTGGAYHCDLCDQTFTQICNMVIISKISKNTLNFLP